MNDRIQQLALQAGITSNNLSDGNMSHTDLKKFAQLIVKECIGILEPKSRYMGEGPEVLKDKIRQIKQHFGVEL